MEEEILEVLFKRCGSVTQAAKKVGLTRETLSDIRNGRREMKLEDAALIAEYMNLHTHTNKKIHFTDLIPRYKKNNLKRVPCGFSYLPFKFKKMFLNDVKHHTKTDWIPDELSDLDKARPIIVDENNQLIANPNTYILHIQNRKIKINAWQISLSKLIHNKYETSDLINTFDEIERGYIGIALKKFMGNRQGHRSDLLKNKSKSHELRLNLDEVTGRTDQIIANLLGFSRTQFRQITNIILHCSDELTEKVRVKKITISAATNCLPFNER